MPAVCTTCPCPGHPPQAHPGASHEPGPRATIRPVDHGLCWLRLGEPLPGVDADPREDHGGELLASAGPGSRRTCTRRPPPAGRASGVRREHAQPRNPASGSGCPRGRLRHRRPDRLQRRPLGGLAALHDQPGPLCVLQRHGAVHRAAGRAGPGRDVRQGYRVGRTYVSAAPGPCAWSADGKPQRAESRPAQP